jgi:hypothetical protein
MERKDRDLLDTTTEARDRSRVDDRTVNEPRHYAKRETVDERVVNEPRHYTKRETREAANDTMQILTWLIPLILIGLIGYYLYNRYATRTTTKETTTAAPVATPATTPTPTSTTTTVPVTTATTTRK